MLLMAVWLCLLVAAESYRPGEPSSFFLKAPKSVPRAGRSAPGDLDSFFLKASKSVPRVGRRNGGGVVYKSVPKVGRRIGGGMVETNYIQVEFSSESPYQQWLKSEYYAAQIPQTHYDGFQNSDGKNQNYPPNVQALNPEVNEDFYEYPSVFPAQLDRETLSHRRRPSYDTLSQDEGRLNTQDNLNKELNEAIYQTGI